MSLRRMPLNACSLVLACLSLGACSAIGTSDGAGDADTAHTDPIIGGTVDKGDPSVVLMKAESGNMGWWCTGTVIAKRLVLTAAHCVEDATSGTKMRVMFGYDQSQGKAADYVQVKEWHHDPQYMATNNIAAGHDAAVLILASDALAPVQPINHQALSKAMVGSPVHVVGFGNDNGQAGTGSGLKREIHTTLTSLEQGVMNVGHGGQTTCQGDSGGPSFMKIGGVDTVVGITSYGEQGCVSYGSSTRVDLSAAWIDPFIAANGGGGDGGSGPGGNGGGDSGGSDPGGNGGGDTGGNGGGGSDPGGCTPVCDGKQCGDDGCGSECGSCDASESCSSAGQCVKPPKPGGCGESEPNDDTDAANAVCAGGTMTGTIDQAADHDYFTFQVAAGKSYDLKLATPHEYVMTLYKVVQDGLYEIESSFDHIQHVTPNGGTYYVEMWGANGDYSPSDAYELTVNVTQ
jgi:V8-like Glu-specific endopeptidase